MRQPIRLPLCAFALTLSLTLFAPSSAPAASGVPGLDELRAQVGVGELQSSEPLASNLTAALPALQREIPGVAAINGAFTSQTFRSYTGALELGTVMSTFGVEEPQVPAPTEPVDPSLIDGPPAPQRSLRVAYLDPSKPLESELRRRPAAAGVLLDPSARSIASRITDKGTLVVVVERDAYAPVSPIVWPRQIDGATFNGITITGVQDLEGLRLLINGKPRQLKAYDISSLTFLPPLAVGTNTVSVNGAVTNVTVTTRAKSDWKFTARVSPAQRRVFRSIMRTSPEPVARRLAAQLRPITVVTIGDRTTDCTANGSSCAGNVNGAYTITLHPSHLGYGRDSKMILWHEFGHIAYFASNDVERLTRATTKAMKGRCIRSSAGLVLPPGTRPPCVTVSEVFADNFAFWATHLNRSSSGYVHKRYLSHAVMRAMLRPTRVHLPSID